MGINSIGDIVIPRTRAELEARLAIASPELAEIIRAALEAGENTEAWKRAEWELS